VFIITVETLIFLNSYKILMQTVNRKLEVNINCIILIVTIACLYGNL